MSVTEDLRIKHVEHVSPPAVVHEEYPITEQAAATVLAARKATQDILQGRDSRLLLVVGPCSIHDPAAALDYARHLLGIRDAVADALLIIMRVYFEKPRTTVGWKGLINDPGLNESFEINHGLRVARKLLLNLAEIGIPAGTEHLDVISPQYYSDLISWAAIGARTTESQVHRELASGLSCPVGFKNGTDGNIKIAIDAVRSASQPHHFLALTKEGHAAIFRTNGNPDCHIILRGGKEPNYDRENVASTVAGLVKARVRPTVMIDCSHANSKKDPEQQKTVARTLGARIASGDLSIFGLMLESHLRAGRQDVILGQPLAYGQSITDACMGWEETEALLHELANDSRQRQQHMNR